MALRAFLSNPGITGHLSDDNALSSTVKELLDNALDACRPASQSNKRSSGSSGGRRRPGPQPSEALIKICISAADAGIQTHTAHSHLLLTVSDDGCGISSIPDSLVLFSSSTKASPQSVATGRFGLGLTSTLLHAWGKTGVSCRVASRGICYEVSFDLDRDEVVLKKVTPFPSSSVPFASGTSVTVPISRAHYASGIAPTLRYLSLVCHVPKSILPAVSFTSPGASALLPTGRPDANFLAWKHKLSASSSSDRHQVSVTLYTNVVFRPSPFGPGSLWLDGRGAGGEGDDGDNEGDGDGDGDGDDNRMAMASCSRILNGSAMLAGAEARSCEMVQGCVSQWRRFGMAAHGQEGESFVLSDLEEAQEGATQGTHDLWTEEGAGTGAHKVPAGERLGRVVIVVSLSGRRGCIEMHGLTKCRVSSTGGAVRSHVEDCVGECLNELSRRTGGEAVRGEEERKEAERMGPHVDLVVGAVKAILARSSDDEWKAACYAKFGRKKQSGKRDEEQGEEKEEEEEDDDAEEGDGGSWGDDEQAFADRMKRLMRSKISGEGGGAKAKKGVRRKRKRKAGRGLVSEKGGDDEPAEEYWSCASSDA